MSLGDVRDFVIVIWGIVSILLVLVRLAIAVGTLYFGRKGMKTVHRLTHEKAVPILQRVQSISEQIRDRTAALPGAPGSTAGVGGIVQVVRSARDAEPPFKRKQKSWRPF